MKTTFKLACAGVALAAAISPAPALAASAVQFLGFGSTFTGFSTDETIGWSFTANANLSVTKFGWFVTAPSLNGDHQVAMWDAAGNLLAQTTILGPGPAQGDGFRYVAAAFAPFQLDAGDTYFIGGRDLNTDGDSYLAGLSFIVTDPAITFVGAARSDNASGFAFPDLVTLGSNGRIGPNFLFDVLPDDPAGPGPGVPEPATWTMMILGLGAAGAMLRRRGQGAPVMTA